MTIEIPQVQPGDLITASFFNGLIEQLTALEARLAKLEGVPTSAGVVISALDKTVMHVGDQLTITGQNFGFSLGAHRVRFNGVAPTSFGAGSSDSVLVCQVPPIPALPSGGGQVTLTVTNVTLTGSVATAVRTITVLPAQIPQAGNIDILLQDVTPDPLTAGVDNHFEFLVSSDATLPALVTLAAHVTVAGQPVSWAIALLNAGHNPLANNQLTLAPSEEQTVFVRVPIPAGANGTVMNLVVEGSAPGLSPASAGLPPMTVGQGGDPDPTFTLSPSPSPAVSGSSITAPAGQQFTPVSVEAHFTVAGQYGVALTQLAGTTGWTTTLVEPPAGTPTVTITQDDLGAAGSEPRTLRFRVRPNAGASDPGQLRLTVQRQGESRSRSFTFDLNVA